MPKRKKSPVKSSSIDFVNSLLGKNSSNKPRVIEPDNSVDMLSSNNAEFNSLISNNPTEYETEDNSILKSI